jgi:hypothetical protein
MSEFLVTARWGNELSQTYKVEARDVRHAIVVAEATYGRQIREYLGDEEFTWEVEEDFI